MYNYDLVRMKELIWEVIVQNTTADTQQWLQKMGDTNTGAANFNTAFILAPRKAGKAVIHISEQQAKNLDDCRHGFTVDGWTTDRLCRVWLLLQLNTADKEKYHRSVEMLFLSAEMNELVALYSALPLLAYPEMWVKRCSEGIRSNIGDVLEAIMLNNSYPAENLGEPAWNQLVLKAFFTEKEIGKIQGLKNRANLPLAHTLADYARERWAAGRTVNPALWPLLGKFIDDKILNDIKAGFAKASNADREAIVLAIGQSDYQPAKDFINTVPV